MLFNSVRLLAVIVVNEIKCVKFALSELAASQYILSVLE